MKTDRRSFLRFGSLLVCGSLLRPESLFALGQAGGGLDRIPLSSVDREVLDFTARYSSSVRLIGGSILARLRGNSDAGMRLVVEVSNLEQLTAALAAAPFENILAQGNTLSFVLQGRERVIENLVPELFAARLAQLAGSRKMHDALSYDPATHQLSDPFGALAA